MQRMLRARLRQGHRTFEVPPGPGSLPDIFRGRPELAPQLCEQGCSACAVACPTGAIGTQPLTLDLGKCLFCTACTDACPSGAIRFRPDQRLAASAREDLVLRGKEQSSARALDEKTRRLFGRSLKLRSVAAGDCSGCAAELVALGNVVFDLGRFGIQFVASPRHADGLVITGPVTRNMQKALLDAWEATPSPRLVIAVGACAISGGPFAGAEASLGGVPREMKVDLYVPGCPPHPLTLIDGLLRLLGRMEEVGGS
ncbi:MAG: 4Fe-4S dicluster domain-containing protein [Candidatus Wallbacteria bacterium]|nr:4Fe-4S dicluster domain-containing protein [Candidatus Wallbacteria bacterium]